MGPEGITILSDSLVKNPNLRYLHLGENAIQNSGASVLFDAFAGSQSLTFLDIEVPFFFFFL